MTYLPDTPKLKNRFGFGSIVVVDGNLIGIVVKTWGIGFNKPYTYEVYVRSYNGIKTYSEEEIRMYVYDKELTNEDMEYQERGG